MNTNTDRAYQALRALGACISIERLATSISVAESTVGRELRPDELRRLAIEVHRQATGEHIGGIQLGSQMPAKFEVL